MKGTGLSIAMIGLRGIPAGEGGVERAVEELSVRLVERGHKVTVFCRNPYCQDKPDTYKGVDLRYFPCVNTKHLEAVTHTALVTFRSLFSKSFDVLHYHATGPALFSMFPRAMGYPVTATVQGLDYERAKWGAFASSFLRTCAWAAGTFPDETIVVSRKLQRHYREAYEKETVYSPNGVTIYPEKPLPFDNRFGLAPEKYVLFLSRIVPEKGLHYLIEAFRGLETDHHLAICGSALHEEDYMKKLEGMAEGDSRIHFLGSVVGEEKEWLFSSAAVYVHPSEIEGLPIALLEAMSYGRCVLVSDIPENAETIGENPVCGRLFRSGNVADLREVLKSLLASPEERVCLGRSARERVAKEYNWDRITDDVEEVYRRVCL